MGPLKGVKIVELAGIGPGPMCAMLLADMGADVVRVDRTEDARLGMGHNPKGELRNRSRPNVAVNLKTPEGVETVLRLIDQADGLIEGYRPGVMERLGLGPDVCLKRNPKLIFGRMTGWGQTGPLAHAAGHDINYISIVGALNAIGPKDGPPVVPLNLIGDFGGGGLYLAMGLLAGIIEARVSGKGQVIDCAMTEGAASLMTMFYGLKAMGRWKETRASNAVDGGAHYYSVYETKDGKYVSVGSGEAKFYALLLEKTGLAGAADLPPQMDQSQWPAMKERLRKIFLTKTRDEWSALMEGSDVCFAPVLNFEESIAHPHNVAREAFVTVDGFTQPAPAPRFERTKSEIRKPPSVQGEDTDVTLRAWGFSDSEIAALHRAGAIKQNGRE
ncbi:MAG TPA: CaiB/BaiF CoA-transferase family protein [Alphaproteobacteria bacterium]|nr:CaiB/BaiF CoA-transferase family protein [Alphaproteobacteria bacterium]